MLVLLSLLILSVQGAWFVYLDVGDYTVENDNVVIFVDTSVGYGDSHITLPHASEGAGRSIKIVDRG